MIFWQNPGTARLPWYVAEQKSLETALVEIRGLSPSSWQREREREEDEDTSSLHHLPYIYTFSRRFYPKWLTVHSDYTLFYQYMRFLEIKPTTFVLLTQCSTTEPQEHLQTRTMEAIRINKRAMICKCYNIYIYI